MMDEAAIGGSLQHVMLPTLAIAASGPDPRLVISLGIDGEPNWLEKCWFQMVCVGKSLYRCRPCHQGFRPLR